MLQNHSFAFSSPQHSDDNRAGRACVREDWGIRADHREMDILGRDRVVEDEFRKDLSRCPCKRYEAEDKAHHDVGKELQDWNVEHGEDMPAFH